MFKSPLEQFDILTLVFINLFGVKVSITNFLLINVMSLGIYFTFVYFNNTSLEVNCHQESFTFFNSNSWQKILENVSKTSTQLISDIILTKNERYVPMIFTVFNFILFSNLIGLIPYTFTVTSHVIITFTISFLVFIGITLKTFQKYKMKIFSLFLPANSDFFLALILVPIEFISYVARPISLGMRLFINLMAGHSLLKVIVGFAWGILLLENINSFGLIIPMVVIVILFGLELGVALIQTYVFIVLTCIYIQDGN